MVYAYDQWAQMPVKDLYDTQVMAMAINAAKDMYDKGEQRMKDFYKEYGDFMSPIQKDMDWYNQNVTGRVRDVINNMYANAIDPLRSAEGRAAVAQLIYNMPAGDIAKVRQSAEAAKEYIKNRGAMQAKGLWNPDYERAILNGGSLEDWDTMNGGVWTRTAPSEYQDLNQYTSHIFDNLKDSYIGTDKNHYDWYGVTENDLYRSLTPDKLGGLLNTDLGRFHYSNAIRDLAAQGNLNPSEAEKMEQFRKNIVAANHERVHQDRKINDMWKLQEEGRQRMRAAAAAHPQPTQRDPQWSFMEQIRRGAVTNITGQQSQEYGPASLTMQRDIQIENGKRISNQYGNRSWRRGAVRAFVDTYAKGQYDPSTMARLVSEGPGGTLRFQYGEQPGSILVTPKDFNRLRTEDDIVSHTTGFRGKKKSTNYSVFNNEDGERPAFVEITFTGRDYGALMKSDRNENHFQGVVRVAYPQKDNNGNTKTDSKGNVQYTWKTIPGTETMYFDSHVTSRKNAPGVGSLGIDAGNGKVKPMPKGLKVTNSHDTKYNDVQMSDKIISDEVTAKTGYSTDAILPEMISWPYIQ